MLAGVRSNFQRWLDIAEEAKKKLEDEEAEAASATKE